MKAVSAIVVGLIAGLGGCAGPRSPVPDFATRPFASFGRDAAIQTALVEWRAFGAPNAGAAAELELDGKPERREGLWQKVGLYWWLGIDPDRRERGWTGRHDETGQEFPASRDGIHPWSAAFISYVMRIAGAGRAFPYSASHAEYINAARRNRGDLAITALDPAREAPVAGDLICFHRDAPPVGFADLPSRRHFAAHCEIVVARHPDRLQAVGGNVADAVALRTLPTLADGRIVDADGRSIDGLPWFVVLRVAYAR